MDVDGITYCGIFIFFIQWLETGVVLRWVLDPPELITILWITFAVELVSFVGTIIKLCVNCCYSETRHVNAYIILFCINAFSLLSLAKSILLLFALEGRMYLFIILILSIMKAPFTNVQWWRAKTIITRLMTTVMYNLFLFFNRC